MAEQNTNWNDKSWADLGLFGTGVPAAYLYKSDGPLDAKNVIDEYNNLEGLVAKNIAYAGMIVYVKDKSMHYTYTGTAWEPFSGDANVNSVSKNIVGTSATATSNGSVTGSDGVYLNHLEDNTVTSTHKIVGSGATSVTSANGDITISSANTKVTSADNHYSPTAATGAELTASLSGTAGAYAKDTEYTVLTGVKAQRDAKGHVTGLTYTAQKIKDTNNTYTVNNATLTLNVGGEAVSGNNAFTANDSTNTTYNVPSATSSNYGVIKVSSVNASAVTVNSETATTGRYYPVELNSDGKAIVNVPWSNSDSKTSSSDTSSTIYLVGATSQTDSGVTTYSHSEVFVDTSHYVNATGFKASSDKRLKENIKEYKPQKSVLDLPIVEFDFIESKAHQIGCLAQDLQEICPEIVTEGDDGYLRIQENKIVYLLLDEVKKLRQEVEELKNK